MQRVAIARALANDLILFWRMSQLELWIAKQEYKYLTL